MNVSYSKKEKSNALTISVQWLDYFVLTYFVTALLLPQFIEWAKSFFTPFMGVVFVVYAIVLTITAVFGLIGMGAIYAMTYTKKFDDPTKEPGIPDMVPFWKYIVGAAKSVAMIALSFHFGQPYISVLCIIAFLYSSFYRIIQKDFSMKMLKLKLAFREQFGNITSYSIMAVRGNYEAEVHCRV